MTTGENNGEQSGWMIGGTKMDTNISPANFTPIGQSCEKGPGYELTGLLLRTY
jgi:hypothetical protein